MLLENYSIAFVTRMCVEWKSSQQCSQCIGWFHLIRPSIEIHEVHKPYKIYFEDNATVLYVYNQIFNTNCKLYKRNKCDSIEKFTLKTHCIWNTLVSSSFTFALRSCDVCRVLRQVVHDGLQSESGASALSRCGALAVVEPHRLPVPVTNCHESPDDVESFRCRTCELRGMGTPIGDVRFADNGERDSCAALPSLFGDVLSVPCATCL